MSDIVIKAENLGKKYIIGHQAERGRYVALRDVLVQNARNFWRTTTDLLNGRPIVQGNNLEEVWALKDVNFEIRRGETVGIIGRNGAGKSTLLKVLSRITEPSAGRVTIKGRVASLLEVGTGFHPELTGRENIYLNGAILGMTRAEVKRKFDEIVAFAEIEKFLDTPVKRYSSGMYVRLAFAVAAHLEPEILLVDEVLAVGDAAFQKKCLGKMGSVAQEGRTVLFVSHNMAAIAKLCQRAFLLKEGVFAKNGKTGDVIDEYFHSPEDTDAIVSYRVDKELFDQHQTSQGDFFIEKIELLDLDQKPLGRLVTGDGMILRISYYAEREFLTPAFMVSITDRYDIEITRLSTMPISGYYIESVEGSGVIELLIEELPLTSGQYSLTLGVARPNVEWILQLRNILSLNVQPCDVYQSGVAVDSSKGLIILRHRWNLL